MTDTRTKSSKHFYVYGGPKAGALASVKAGTEAYTYMDRSGPRTVRYRYVLVSAAGGGSAFVPEDDEGLRQAFLSASGEPGDRETETLAAEIQRRGLEI